MTSEQVSCMMTELLDDLAVSPALLAKTIGVNRRSLYRWKRGENVPHPVIAAKVTEIYRHFRSAVYKRP